MSSLRNLVISLVSGALSAGLLVSLVLTVAPLRQYVSGIFGQTLPARSSSPSPNGGRVLSEKDEAVSANSITSSLESLVGRLTTLENQVLFPSSDTVSFSSSALSATAVNLIRNSSFESADGEKPRQWSYILDATTANTKQSNEGIRSGSYGLKFSGADADGHGLDLGIAQSETETVPGRTYTLSLYLKHTNVQEDASVRLGFWDKYNNRYGPMKTVVLTGTKDWYRISTTVTTTGLVTDYANWYPMLEVRRLKEGDAVYIDDVQLEEGSVITLYNSAVAGGTTNSFITTFGDGSILGTTTGTIYPAQNGIGSLGTSSNRWHDLYLSKVTISENGDLNLDGDATVGGALTVNDSATLKGNVTLGDSSDDTITITGMPTFSALSSFTGGITVGTNGEFSISSSGDITSIKGVPYAFPASQGAAGTLLQNDGDGDLTWAAPAYNSTHITRTLPLAPENYVEIGTVSGANSGYVDITIVQKNGEDPGPTFSPQAAKYTIPVNYWFTPGNTWVRVYPTTQTGLANSWEDGNSYRLEYKNDNGTYYFRLKRSSRQQTFTLRVDTYAPLAFAATSATGTDDTTITTNIGTSSETRFSGNSIMNMYGQYDFYNRLGFNSRTASIPTYAGVFIDSNYTSYTDSGASAGGTVANVNFHLFGSPNLLATNTGVTTTAAKNIAIRGTPIASTNQTITNAYSLYIDNGGPGSSTTNAYGLYVNAPNSGSNRYAAIFTGGNVGLGTATPTALLDVAGTTWLRGAAGGTSGLFVKLGGNVGIGTTAPAYKLDVNGDINTTGDIRKNGAAYTNPDYVFEPNYDLMSLQELKGYVSTNKHLPNVPSSEDIKRDGVKLFEQTRLNLEKTEEAYLYLFDLDNRLNELSLPQDPPEATTLAVAGATDLNTAALQEELAAAQDQMLTLEERLGIVEEKDKEVASISATLISLKADVDLLKSTQTVASISAQLAESDLPVTTDGDATVLSDLIVTGKANIFDLAVLNRISTGLLSIDGLSCMNEQDCVASISTLSGPLAIQEKAAGPLEIMAKKIVIDTNGDMKIEGKLTVGEIAVESVKTKTVETESVNLKNDVVLTSGDTLPKDPCKTGATYVYNDKKADEARMYICSKKSWKEVTTTSAISSETATPTPTPTPSDVPQSSPILSPEVTSDPGPSSAPASQAE